MVCFGVQAYIGFRSSIWSFNPVVAAWEPVMEPWDIILKLDVNPSPLVPPNCLVQDFTNLHCSSTTVLGELA